MKKNFAAFIVLLSAILLIPGNAKTIPQPVCRIAGMSSVGYIMSAGASQLRLALPGDSLFSGEYLIVRRGDEACVVFDEEGRQMARLRGRSVMRVRQTDIVEVELPRGDLFASLKSAADARTVELRTDHGMAEADEAIYRIRSDAFAMLIENYKGKLHLFGYDRHGQVNPKSMFLEDSETAVVSKTKKSMHMGPPLSGLHYDAANRILGVLGETSEFLNYSELIQKEIGPKDDGLGGAWVSRTTAAIEALPADAGASEERGTSKMIRSDSAPSEDKKLTVKTSENGLLLY